MLFRVCIWLLLPAAALAQTYSTNHDGQLAALIEEALERNPQVQAAFSNYQGTLQRIPQVTALPDPMLAVTQYASTPETRVGPQTTVVSVTQRLPWFGKRSDQGGMAAKHAAAEEEMYRARRAETVRSIKLAYYDLAYVDRALLINREEELLLEQYETLAEARYAQGVGLQQAVVRLQAEITRVLSRRQDLKRQRVDAEATINALRDRPGDSPVATVKLAQRPRLEIDAARLLEIGRNERPELRAALLNIERNEKSIQLARRQYWPDFNVGAAWGNVLGRRDEAGRKSPPPDNGKDVYSVSVGVNIPLFRGKYDAGVQEASERFTSARESYRSVVNILELSVRSISFRLATVEEQISLFERALLPQSDQALRSVEAAYSSGTAGVLDLLDSERMLLEVRLGQARLESDYMKALAEMERAIGTAFPEEMP